MAVINYSQCVFVDMELALAMIPYHAFDRLLLTLEFWAL